MLTQPHDPNVNQLNPYVRLETLRERTREARKQYQEALRQFEDALDNLLGRK